MTGPLTIGKVAAAAAMTTDTIRYYERVGLLPKVGRTNAGYRVYPASIVRRLRLIRNAQRFGFSLREIAAFLRVRDRGGKPCHDVRLAAQRRLDAVEQDIATLIQTSRQMRETLDEWDRMLARTPADSPAHLLEAL